MWRDQRGPGYHADAAISDEYLDGMSEGDMDDVGNNPSRPAAGNEHARVLREKLRAFVTEAEKIKGRVYGEAANEARWNRRLVMSEDNKVIEVGLDGTTTDLTAVLDIANSSGFLADEALQAVTNECKKCGEITFGHSSVILMDVDAGGVHQYWCFG